MDPGTDRLEEERTSIFLARLTELCGIDGPSGDAEGVDACAELLASWLAGAGCEVEYVPTPDGRHLVASLVGAGEGRVILVGHHDTVYRRGAAMARPVRVFGRRALGPGVADMKGGLLVGVAAIEELAAGDHESFSRVELHSVPDEEARVHAPHNLDLMTHADLSIVLECGRPSGAVIAPRKAATWLHVEAAGREAHAGADPHLGRSALAALIAELTRIERDVDGVRDGLTAIATRLVADGPNNAIPGHVTAVVDLRAMSDEDLAWAVKEGTRFGDHDGVAFTVTDTVRLPAMESPPALTAAALEALARAGFEGGGR